jgi:hypothetical protein
MTKPAATLISSTVVTSTLLAASIALSANAQALEPNRDLSLPAQSLTERASATPTPAMVHALRKAKSRTFSARDGQVLLWQPGQARDLVARFVNRGNERVEIRVLNEKNAIEDVYTLYPKSQSLDLRFVNTGTPSVEIFINYSNGTSKLIDLSTGHFQDFELITTEDDVLSVTYHCDENQGLACGNCTFDYHMAVN